MYSNYSNTTACPDLFAQGLIKIKLMGDYMVEMQD
jgi:hypothetical protein